jgi:EAL domain-containing protein (putative c-di-GMP-specific phosphodiesterase class I)
VDHIPHRRGHPRHVLADPTTASDPGELGRRLRVHYQPVMSLGHGTVVVRSPDRFIPFAEQTGLILPLGQMVLREAAHQVARWSKAFRAHLAVHVNVSPLQLVGHALVDDVAEVLRSSGLRPHELVLEVTESHRFEDSRHVSRIIAQLRALGVRVALDDFGTGWSSLARLRELEVDMIKLDRSFVAVHEPRQRLLAEGIIELATTLGVVVVAEGVETPEQAEWLSSVGCQEAQGYRWAFPMDTATTLQHLVRAPLQPTAPTPLPGISS